MRTVRVTDFRRMPWKNGGGSTTEVMIAPAGAALDDFDWRISMAHVAISGPFSRFPGIDRTLAVIAGAGICLAIEGAMARLERNSPPFFFSGDVETSATLIEGPIDDLNVMSNRARFRHRMTRHAVHEAAPVPADADYVAVMPQGGNAELEMGGQSTPISDGDTLILERADIAPADTGMLQMQSGGADAALYLIAFWRNGA